MSEQRSSSIAPSRVIRVFVSSTFLDMYAEREELIKRVFPQLRKLCAERGVTWSEVDLRWGITDEQSADDQIIPICLREIDQCHPFFIGLLGERYGWVPDGFPPELVGQEAWLAECQGRSATELEILHGALNNPPLAGHAYFYFRDPAYVDGQPESERAKYCELPGPGEIEIFGIAEAKQRAETRRQNLLALKERIRMSGLPVHENYRDPVALGKLVLQDFTALIERLYPLNALQDPLDREAAEHDSFAASRARVYIGRQSYFDALDAHVQEDGLPLVVVGESGSGKSALLANWALRYRAAHTNELVLTHFVGASSYSTDWAAMLRRILRELKRRFDIQEEIPDQPDALRAAFANWLHRAAAKGRVVLVLDAFNQLEDRDGAPDLVWLPPVIPPNVRLILSALPGRSLAEIQKRNWPTLQVELLAPDERKQLISLYLTQHAKSLSPERIDHIASAPQTANPLYLRILLEELRVFGVNKDLEEYINSYLAAGDPSDLYQRILARYEQDYERDHLGLVREVMSLLWAARRGLTEMELLELLGTNGEPLPQAYWSPLYLAAEQSLINISGLLGFSHTYLRQAVEQRYLSAEAVQQSAHLRLADYFAAVELLPRKVDEAPWQLAEAKSWERLYRLMTDLEFARKAWQMDVSIPLQYWSLIEKNSPLNRVTGYQQILNNPDAFDYETAHMIGLLFRAGHPREAAVVFEGLVERCRKTGDRANLPAALGELALVRMECGAGSAVLELLKEQEQVCRELGNQRELAVSLMEQGHIQDQKYKALELYREAKHISQELGDRNLYQTMLGNEARILLFMDKLDEAMVLLKEQEQTCREQGNREGLGYSFGNQAEVFHRRDDWATELALLEEAEQIFRELGKTYELATCLGNQIRVMAGTSDTSLALRKLEEAEKICDDRGYTELGETIFMISYETGLVQLKTLMPEGQLSADEMQFYANVYRPETMRMLEQPYQPPPKERPLWVTMISIGFWLSAVLVVAALIVPIHSITDSLLQIKDTGIRPWWVILYLVFTGIGLWRVKRWGILLSSPVPLSILLIGVGVAVGLVTGETPLDWTNTATALINLVAGLGWSIGAWKLWKE